MTGMAASSLDEGSRKWERCLFDKPEVAWRRGTRAQRLVMELNK